MRDMAAAVERIARAIAQRERILIYGDYDVDGTSSVVLLTKAFELAGGLATYHVPHRLKDGYGMRPEVVEAAAAQGVKLIVSRGHRHPRRRGGAARQRTRHRRDRHRSSSAGERNCRRRWRCSIPTGRTAPTRRRICAAPGWRSS